MSLAIYAGCEISGLFVILGSTGWSLCMCVQQSSA